MWVTPKLFEVSSLSQFVLSLVNGFRTLKLDVTKIWSAEITVTKRHTLKDPETKFVDRSTTASNSRQHVLGGDIISIHGESSLKDTSQKLHGQRYWVEKINRTLKQTVIILEKQLINLKRTCSKKDCQFEHFVDIQIVVSFLTLNWFFWICWICAVSSTSRTTSIAGHVISWYLKFDIYGRKEKREETLGTRLLQGKIELKAKEITTKISLQ